MKTRLFVFLVVLGLISTSLTMNSAFAMCMVNDDWPDAPCMDMIVNGHYPQEQVDRWTDYYDFKGEEIMQFKKTQMNHAIQNNELEQWTDESLENYNVYTYFHFTGEAPSLPPYHSVGFELINRENMPIQNLVSTHNPFWFDPNAWILASIVASIVGVPFIIVWKRKKCQKQSM